MAQRCRREFNDALRCGLRRMFSSDQASCVTRNGLSLISMAQAAIPLKRGMHISRAL